MSDERVGANRTLLDSPQQKEDSSMDSSSHSRTPRSRLADGLLSAVALAEQNLIRRAGWLN